MSNYTGCKSTGFFITGKAIWNEDCRVVGSEIVDGRSEVRTDTVQSL